VRGVFGAGALAGRVPLPIVRARQGLELSSKAFTWECAGCGRQTSVTAGTVMHASKLPLTVWFWAAQAQGTARRDEEEAA
jgi:hypothetical protein